MQSDFDDDYADEIAVGRTGSGSAAAAAGSAASQLAKSKSQQTSANSGFDNDVAALEEETYSSGLQGSGSRTGECQTQTELLVSANIVRLHACVADSSQKSTDNPCSRGKR